jgi:hypothetical protein
MLRAAVLSLAALALCSTLGCGPPNMGPPPRVASGEVAALTVWLGSNTSRSAEGETCATQFRSALQKSLLDAGFTVADVNGAKAELGLTSRFDARCYGSDSVWAGGDVVLVLRDAESGIVDQVNVKATGSASLTLESLSGVTTDLVNQIVASPRVARFAAKHPPRGVWTTPVPVAAPAPPSPAAAAPPAPAAPVYAGGASAPSEAAPSGPEPSNNNNNNNGAQQEAMDGLRKINDMARCNSQCSNQGISCMGGCPNGPHGAACRATCSMASSSCKSACN